MDSTGCSLRGGNFDSLSGLTGLDLSPQDRTGTGRAEPDQLGGAVPCQLWLSLSKEMFTFL